MLYFFDVFVEEPLTGDGKEFYSICSQMDELFSEYAVLQTSYITLPIHI